MKNNLRLFAILLSIKRDGKSKKKSKVNRFMAHVWAPEPEEAVSLATQDALAASKGKRWYVISLTVDEVQPLRLTPEALAMKYPIGASPTKISSRTLHPFDPEIIRNLSTAVSRGSGLFLSVEDVDGIYNGIAELLHEDKLRKTSIDNARTSLTEKNEELTYIRQANLNLTQALTEARKEMYDAQAKSIAALQTHKDFAGMTEEICHKLRAMGTDPEVLQKELGITDPNLLGMMQRIMELNVGIEQAIGYLNVLYDRVEAVRLKYPDLFVTSSQEIVNWGNHLKAILARTIDFPSPEITRYETQS
jgi:hypothetical protein